MVVREFITVAALHCSLDSQDTGRELLIDEGDLKLKSVQFRKMTGRPKKIT
jgi:hypothetical protein